MAFIWMLIIGFIAGAIARAIKPGADAMGWVMTIVLGVAGSFVGGLIAGMLGLSANGGFGGLVLSVIGAIIILFAYEFISGKRRLR
ncbi:MAG: GlsB/YeaQ/YmgE family stress response membrane protein [Moraxella sp.]|nr:GlsB/YeaQ/YmgE family stress response membrane protein [Moraxella sp.]